MKWIIYLKIRMIKVFQLEWIFKIIILTLMKAVRKCKNKLIYRCKWNKSPEMKEERKIEKMEQLKLEMVQIKKMILLRINFLVSLDVGQKGSQNINKDNDLILLKIINESCKFIEINLINYQNLYINNLYSIYKTIFT